MSGMIIAKAVIALSLKVVNIVIHSVGIYILRCLRRNGKEDVQMIYIINLSITELIINVTSFVRNLLKLMPFSIFKSSEFRYVVLYSYIADYIVLKVSLYITMVIITLDRMFLVMLNVFYPVYWSIRKSKLLIRVVWLVSMVTFIVISVLHNNACKHVYMYINETIALNENITNINETIALNGNFSKSLYNKKCQNYQNMFFLIVNYITVTFDFMFIIISVVSYGIIFHKLKQSQRNQWKPKSTTQKSLWQIFRKSRFDSVLLLVLTFVFFVIPADLLWAFYLTYKNKTIELLTTISYAISYLSDGLIYIFMNEKVKELLFRKLRNITEFSRTKPNKTISDVIFCEQVTQYIEDIPLSHFQSNQQLHTDGYVYSDVNVTSTDGYVYSDVNVTSTDGYVYSDVNVTSTLQELLRTPNSPKSNSSHPMFTGSCITKSSPATIEEDA